MCPLKGKACFEGDIIHLNCLIRAQPETAFSRIMFIYIQACFWLSFFVGVYIFKICIHESENFLLYLTEDKWFISIYM